MGTKSWRRDGDTSSARIVSEPKKGRLALRRLVKDTSHSHINSISSALDQSGEVMERGMLYIPRYCRFTIFGTEELPLGKKRRTSDVVAKVPSCFENLSVELGGFLISQLNNDKPKLAIRVLSIQADDEKLALRTAFNEKGLQLREPLNGPRIPHLSIAELDRGQEEYFTETKLMELNEIANATITDAGVYMGRIILRPVSMPKL